MTKQDSTEALTDAEQQSEDAVIDALTEEVHEGHFPHFGGGWFCDTCNSPYCELA